MSVARKRSFDSAPAKASAPLRMTPFQDDTFWDDSLAMGPRLLRDAQTDQEDAGPEQEAADADPKSDAPVGGAAQRGQRQDASHGAVEPGAEQADLGGYVYVDVGALAETFRRARLPWESG